MPLCVCYSCKSIMDCDPSGVCELCDGVTGVVKEQPTTDGGLPEPDYDNVSIIRDVPSPDDRQVLNFLQRLHQNILRESEAYVSYTKDCRWQFGEGVYRCEHVSIKEEDVAATYKRQMEN